MIRDLKQDCQCTRIVICSRRSFHRIVVGGQNQRRDVLLASHGSNDITIGTAECVERMADDIKAVPAELLSEIVFCVLEPAR